MKVYILWFDDKYESNKELRKIFVSREKAEEYRKNYIEEHCPGWNEPEEWFPITEHNVE